MQSGKFLDEAIVYPHKPQGKVDQAKKILRQLIDKYNIDVIAIGNGTASRESESLIS